MESRSKTYFAKYEAEKYELWLGSEFSFLCNVELPIPPEEDQPMPLIEEQLFGSAEKQLPPLKEENLEENHQKSQSLLGSKSSN